MAASIALSYTAQQGDQAVYNIEIKEFTGRDLPRSYVGNANITTSANGSAIITGPSYRQKVIWAVSTITDKAAAIEIDNLYKAWDFDRSAGMTAAVGVVDTTFGATLDSNAVFSTPPTFILLSPATVQVDFGLSEV